MRLFGHPLHPMLVHFPVAFWTLGTVCDGLALVGFTQPWLHGWVLLALGLIFSIPAMVAGLIDLARLEDTAIRDGNLHMTLMALAWTAYLCALIARLEGKTLSPDPQLLSTALSVLGLGLMMLGGWYGGQLIYTHRSGVKEHD